MARQASPYKDAPRWLKPKPYPHFDAAYRGRRLKARVTHAENRQRVATRRFYPFLRRIQATVRFVRPQDENGTSTPGAKRKRTRKLRPIAYAAHTDAHVFACYGHKLERAYKQILDEDNLSDCVVAYRRIRRRDGKGKSNVDHAGDVFRFVQDRARDEPLLALAFDIADFFGSMDHQLLKEQWVQALPDSEFNLQYPVFVGEEQVMRDGSGGGGRLPKDHYNVFRAVTRYSYVEQRDLWKAFRRFYRQSREKSRGRAICRSEDFQRLVRGQGLIRKHPLACGVPQGSPMSAVLSNLYMLPLDRTLERLLGRLGGLYRRYSDDLIFVVPEWAGPVIERAVEAAIVERKLKPQHKKTERVRFFLDGERVRCEPCDGKTRQLQYLGFTFDGSAVSVRPASLNRYLRKVQDSVPAIQRRARYLSRNRRTRNGKRFRLDPKRVAYRLYTHHADRYSEARGRRPFNFILYLERACRRLEERGLDTGPVQKVIGRHMSYVHHALKSEARGRQHSKRTQQRQTSGGY